MRVFFYRALYGLLLWGAALWLAWLLLAATNFFYSPIYRLLDIEHTVQTYVPHNRHGRQDYPTMDTQLHAEHFAAMVRAIHAQGAGLAEIHYRSAQGDKPLLTRDEILHLQDVAHLVRSGLWFGAGMALAWLLLNVWLLRQRVQPPSFKALAMGSVLVVGVIGVWLALFGFEKVFYQLHIWIFPADHPWFFYYQDSLMSTLMQAPNLFAVIGLLWFAMALLLLWMIHALASSLNKRFST